MKRHVHDGQPGRCPAGTAQYLQPEIDHPNGILHIDRWSPLSRLPTLARYRQAGRAAGAGVGAGGAARSEGAGP